MGQTIIIPLMYVRPSHTRPHLSRISYMMKQHIGVETQDTADEILFHGSAVKVKVTFEKWKIIITTVPVLLTSGVVTHAVRMVTHWTSSRFMVLVLNMEAGDSRCTNIFWLIYKRTTSTP